jgi:outer membrane murein-binding lipoprotein Lpp
MMALGIIVSVTALVGGPMMVQLNAVNAKLDSQMAQAQAVSNQIQAVSNKLDTFIAETAAARGANARLTKEVDVVLEKVVKGRK